MGDLECGFEEMQGVRLGYLLIQGKQMFALSQVFTELLKNIPRTTVHKRMDHLNVKKHHCDLDELRKLKAINSIAFHAAKCTLISREDVEALYFSCKTERVLKSGHGKSKAASRAAADGLADAQLWQKKVWLSLHGVQDKARRGRREPCDSKLPHFYHKSHGRGCRPATKPTRRHFKNYETAKLQGNRLTFGQKHSFFRSAPAAALQSAMAAQSRLSRAAGDPHHKRKRRREGGGGGGGGRDGPRHPWRSRHRQHVPPVLLVQPRSSVTHRAAFGAFQLSPDFYLHRHHLEPSFPESSDTESSTYSDRAYPDSDFGSGFSTSSSSEEEEEDEDETQSETTEVSTDEEEEEEEESSSHSDSSSVSSRVSVQSIRFRRARVGALAKTLNPITAPLVLQPTFHYNHHQQPHVNSPPQSHVAAAHKAERGHEECGFRNSPGSKFLSVIFAEDRPDEAGPIPDAVVDRVRFEPHANKGLCAARRTSACPIGEPRGRDKEAKFTGQRLPTPPKKIKTENEELAVTAPPRSESGCKLARTPPLALHKVKLKAEDCRNEYEYQCQADAVNFKVPPIDTQHSGNADPPVDVKSDEDALEAAAAHGYLSTRERLEEGDTRTQKCRASELGGRARLSRAQSRQSRVTRAASSTSSIPPSQPCEEASAENLPSRRKRSSSSSSSSANTWTCGVKLPFSLMANFPFSPSLAVGSDGDLCPAYSLNSLRGLGPPPPSHPVWSWQPGGHVLPPPLTHRTAK